MEKIKLEKFISKYTFGGAVEAVTWESDGVSVHTTVSTKDKNAGGQVKLIDADGFPKGKFSIYETKKLKAMLSIVGDDVTIKPHVQNDVAKSIEFSSGNTKATFVLADESVIPEAKSLTKLPPFDIVIQLDDQLMLTFLRAKAALSDVEVFHVSCDGKESVAQLTLGLSNKNTNRAVISAKIEGTPTQLDPIKFSATFLKEIFLANKEVVGGTMAVSSRGLCIITLNTSEYAAMYHLIKVNDDDDA